MQDQRIEVDIDPQESEQAVVVVEKTMDVQTDQIPSVETLDGVNGFATGTTAAEHTRLKNGAAAVDDIERPATRPENAIDIDRSEVNKEVIDAVSEDDEALTEEPEVSLPPKAMASGLQRGIRLGLP